MEAEAMMAQEAANNVVQIPGQKQLPQGHIRENSQSTRRADGGIV
jgi:hypothetical protein